MTDDIPLSMAENQDWRGILLLCVCGKSKTIPVETARQVAGPNTGVREVFRFAKRACECGRKFTESRPEFAPGPDA